MSTNAPRSLGRRRRTSFFEGILLPNADTPRATVAVGLVLIALLLLQVGREVIVNEDGLARVVLLPGVGLLAFETGRRLELIRGRKTSALDAGSAHGSERLSGSESSRRWTALEDDARPGQTFNSEAGASMVDATLKTFGGLGPLIGAYELHDWERKGEGIELVATADEFILTTKDAEVTVPWAEMVNVNLARFPARSGPVITIDVVDGRTIEVPDQLYVDALGDFASMRHKARAREIANEMRRHIGQSGKGDQRTPRGPRLEDEDR